MKKEKKSNATESPLIVPWEYTSFDDTTLRESLGNIVVSQESFEKYYKVQVEPIPTKKIKNMSIVSRKYVPIPRLIPRSI
jgi:hypothetical protein